ncbi:hypothetical protein OH492_11675 [Vibrio chagasii]|nr:hypothetical protein [Vibrio chagasii]
MRRRRTKMISQLEANGMQVNRDVDGKAFQEAIRPVWNAYIEKNGDVMISKIKVAAKVNLKHINR